MGAVAMLCKETGATVFGVCVAYDLVVHSRQQLVRCEYHISVLESIFQ